MFSLHGVIVSDGGVIMNDELERMWKDAIVAYLKLAYLHTICLKVLRKSTNDHLQGEV